MNDISGLIIRHLLGTATQEEERLLEAWRQESAGNEAAFQRLHDTSFLEKEWRKRKAVNWQRAAQQMKVRTGSGRRPIFLRIAAAVALLTLGAAGVMVIKDFNGSRDNMEVALAQPTLKAGVMKAVLHPYPMAGTQEEGIVVTSGQELKAALAQCRSDVKKGGSDTALDEGDGAQASISLTVPRGGEFKIELEDGTQVWLNAQSRLVYPETFSATERRVMVEGEAYFNVARDENKPFLVETSGQMVRVVGTEFNVHSYAEDKAVLTTLVRGKVAIAPITGEGAMANGPSDAGERGLILSPGRQAIYDKEAGSIRVKSVDTEVVTSWKDGMFVFEDMTLEEIMLTLSRWYDFEYEFKDRRSAGTVFMGRIPRYSDFVDVMEIIELSGGLKLSLTGRRLTISSTGK